MIEDDLCEHGDILTENVTKVIELDEGTVLIPCSTGVPEDKTWMLNTINTMTMYLINN